MRVDDDAVAVAGGERGSRAGRPSLSQLVGPWNATADWLGNRGAAFWAVLLLGLGCLIYLPRLGAFPLWDPWEPHYTQVAWEMQERLTWNNPWYRGLDNWWSKPILMLWMLRASLASFWDAAREFANNEWAARLPFALFAIGGGLLHFDWVRRLYGLRIGVLAGLMLLTAPQYLLVGRQVMADTPFVVTYAASLGYLAVGLFTARRAAAPSGASWIARTGAWVARNWPFVLFWVMQALSVLAKGFVAPVLAIMILAGYWAATFRWRDFGELVAGRRWLRYALVRGAIVAAAAAVLLVLVWLVHPRSPEERELFRAMVGGFGGLAVLLGALHDLPPVRHALRLLARMRASWGLALFLAVAAPWFVYMTIEHGWPYWKEFIFYHHLGRAAGTIDKPNNTFDYFVRQLAFAAFPWTAFVVGAAWSFLGRSSPLRSIAQRRNLFVLLATALPFLFFTLAATKFAHYIMPVVPLLTVMLAATLVWLGRDGETVALAEEGPPLGPVVEAYAAAERQPWWSRHGARGDLMVFAAMALIVFGILAHDLVLDFRHFLRLFVYYYNRPTPPGYQPFILLQEIFFPIGIVIGTLLLSRRVGRGHLTLLSAGAVVLACYLSWFMMPAMQSTYSFKPFYEAYERMAKPNEPIGQYNDWQQPVRSVIFLFQNRAVHLRTDAKAAAFLARPGRKFVLVDRDRLPKLRRVARGVGVTLYVVFDGHPYGRMVSDQPNAEDTREAARHILGALPPGVEHADAELGDSIRLLGWSAPRVVKRGESVEISFYYRCERTMDRDWQIFVHGDGPQGGSHRIHRDHFPVGGLYPTTEWQEGEIIRDTFTLTVPRRYPFDHLHLWTGFYIGEERMKLEAGPRNDGQDRFRGPMLQVVD